MTVKSISKKELAEMYGVSAGTFRSWIIRAGLIGEGKIFQLEMYMTIRVFTPKQVSAIYAALGEP